MIHTLLFAASISILACPPKGCPDSPYSRSQLAARSDFRASTFKRSAQAEAALDVDSGGDITVVWSSRKQQQGRSAVYMQRFTSEGVAIGGETQLNLWTQSHQISPVIAGSRAGDTWIAWQSHGQDGYAGSIIARRFSTEAGTEGSFVGSSEILVNQEWIGDQIAPAVAAFSDGAAVFAWTSTMIPEEPPQARARLFDSEGNPITDEFAVASADAARIESLPGIAVASDDSFAIVFAIADERGNPAGIRMQRFDRCGARIGAEITIDPDAPGAPIEPVIAAADFGYVIAWERAQPDGEDYDVLAQRLDRQGNALGEPFRVDLPPTPGLQNGPAIAARNGQFIIAWNGDDGHKTGIFAQAFSNDGARLGEPFRINTATKGDQAMRPATSAHQLAFEPNGTLLCAWSGDGGFGDESAAHVSMLSLAPLDLRAQVQGVTPDMVPAASPDEQALAAASTSGGGPEPHVPPTFDPRTIDEGRRDYVYGVTDFGFTGVLSTGWTPPDPHMGVGPNHLVLMTNGAIAFLTKAGVSQFQSPIEGASGFWGSVGATNFVFDPEVLYDPMSGRFFAMASEQTSSSQSFILIAVSDDSDPNGTWYKYRFNTTALAGETYDSPNIAVDANVVYISGDGSNGTYPMFMYDKASLLAGLPPAITRTVVMPTTTQSAGMPAVSFDNPPALYFIEHKESPSNTQVRLLALTDPLGTPAFTSLNMNVATYGPPENPPQAGTTVRPITFDARFWSCAYRNGSLWATHHINSARVIVRWYEFAMNGWPTSGNLPALVQSGNIDPGGTVRTFFTAVTADAQNNAALVFARSSPSEFISMQTAYRSHNDPPNTFQPMVQRQINTGAYTVSRWGDYARMQVDPVDGHTMWVHHEYAQGNVWRTWVQSFFPGIPCPADISPAGPPKGDGVVNSADLLEVINHWGLCAGCPADINNDAAVNAADLLAVIDAWGPCP